MPGRRTTCGVRIGQHVSVPTIRDEVLSLFDFAWARLRHRLIGLTDDEWAWLPTDDPDIGLRWRLAHLGELLRDHRNATWLARAPGGIDPKPATDATEAIAQLEAAYAEWRGHLSQIDDATLRTLVGPVGGPFTDSTRLAFVLHLADELIHHGAETALLRDLYVARSDATLSEGVATDW